MNKWSIMICLICVIALQATHHHKQYVSKPNEVKQIDKMIRQKFKKTGVLVKTQAFPSTDGTIYILNYKSGFEIKVEIIRDTYKLKLISYSHTISQVKGCSCGEKCSCGNKCSCGDKCSCTSKGGKPQNGCCGSCTQLEDKQQEINQYLINKNYITKNSILLSVKSQKGYWIYKYQIDSKNKNIISLKIILNSNGDIIVSNQKQQIKDNHINNNNNGVVYKIVQIDNLQLRPYVMIAVNKLKLLLKDKSEKTILLKVFYSQKNKQIIIIKLFYQLQGKSLQYNCQIDKKKVLEQNKIKKIISIQNQDKIQYQKIPQNILQLMEFKNQIIQILKKQQKSINDQIQQIYWMKQNHNKIKIILISQQNVKYFIKSKINTINVPVKGSINKNLSPIKSNIVTNTISNQITIQNLNINKQKNQQIPLKPNPILVDSLPNCKQTDIVVTVRPHQDLKPKLIDNNQYQWSQQSSCLQYDGFKCIRCAYRYYLANDHCIKVSDSCSSYNSKTGECLDCYQGYYLSKGMCLEKIAVCAKVNNQGICIECFKNYVLIKNQCFEKSNLRKNFDNTVFRDPLCADWINDICQKCSYGAYLNNGLCVMIDPNCQQFDQKNKICHRCMYGYDNQNGKCIRKNS